MFKVSNKNARTVSGVFILNFERISQLPLMLLLTLKEVKVNREIINRKYSYSLFLFLSLRHRDILN